MTRRIENLWDSVRGLLLTQYEESENLKAFIRVFVEALQGIEDSSGRLRNFADLDIADGRWLDLIGGIKNVNREPGESDEAFKGRLSIEFGGTRAGTSAGVVDTAARLSGDPSPAYLDEAPGVFFVYTPNGKQIKRDDVQKLAPAGVIGLPGAAIKMGDGSFLGDADGNMILTAAQDDVDELWENCGSEHEITVVDSGEEKLIDDGEGGYIVAYEKLSDTDKFEED